MPQCTAPIRGHRSARSRANCPVCGSRYSRYNYPGSKNFFRPSFGNHSIKKARWSPASSSLSYSEKQIRTLSPYRTTFEKRSETMVDSRDIFLCHAWDDRKGIAYELYQKLVARGVKVWFSEKDAKLGLPLLREIDKGLANSKIGIVLVTPSFITRVKNEGVAEKELAALLAKDLLVPVLHAVSFEDLYAVSPLLASRGGLSTSEESMDIIADRLAELVSDEK